jgi:hypothetical protein
VFLAAAGGSAGSRIAEEPPGQMHIEDPFTPGYNIARNSWKWQQAISLFQVRAAVFVSGGGCDVW